MAFWDEFGLTTEGGEAGGIRRDPTPTGASLSSDPDPVLIGPDGRPVTPGPTSGTDQSSAGQPNAGGGNPVAAMMAQFPGMSPQVAQMFVSTGRQPTGRGSGPSDWQYIQDKINADPSSAGYFLDRFTADLQGRGMDVGGGGMAASGLSLGSLGLAPIQAPTMPTPQHISMPALPTRGSSPTTSGLTYGGASTVAPFQATAFTAPTLAQAQQDPGYQFRLQQGQQALENSASARGGLLSGATGKALLDYGQQAATQEYGNVYNRALQTNQLTNATNLNAYNANLGAQLGIGNLNFGYQSAANQYDLGQGQLGLGYFNATNQYNLEQDQLGLGYFNAANNYNLGLGQLALGNTQAQNSYALGLGNQGLGWANYGLNANQQNFGQQLSLADLGLNAAQLAGNFGGQYGGNAGSAYTNIGNAQAGGAIGAGNAIGGSLGNLGNDLMNFGVNQAYQSGYNRRPYAAPQGTF